MEHPSYKQRQRALGLVSLRSKLNVDLIYVYKYLTGGCRKGRTRLFLVVLSDRTRGIGHKLKYKEFHLSIILFFFFTVNVVKHWNRIPRELVEFPSLEESK